MKFHSIQSFEKHLQETFPKDISHLYAVIATDLIERRFLIDKILQALKKAGITLEKVSYLLEESSFEEIRDELEAQDLFSGNKIILLKHFEKASASFLENTAEVLARGCSHYVIFEGEEWKADKFYEKLKKEIIVIDLSKEKPWERKQRLFSWIEGVIQRNRKNVHKEVLDILYDRCEKNFSAMMQEVEKWLIYGKDEQTFTKKELEKLCGYKPETNNWSLAEEIVWEGSITQALDKKIDQSQFFSILGQLRYQCELGVKIKQLLLSGASQENVYKAFPQLQSKTMQKYLSHAQHYRLEYFQQAQALLSDYELEVKSSPLKSHFFWTTLLIKLKNLQMCK